MKHVQIGTRGSPMALVQAETVARAIRAQLPDVTTELIEITTSGDKWMADLSRLGGKGAFVREIDQGLLKGDFDLAVHSMKDIPGDVPLLVGLELAAHLPRDQVQDAAISRTGELLGNMPRGARVGTSSVRRRAQLLSNFPQLNVLPVRGNVNTRLARLDNGDFDALVLASSGLARVGLEHMITELLPLDVMRPPVGSAVIVVQCRSDDKDALSIAQHLNDPRTETCVAAERAVLFELHGHCNSPIAGHARFVGASTLELRAAVFDLDGSTIIESSGTGDAADPYELGIRVAWDLIAQGADVLIEAIPH